MKINNTVIVLGSVAIGAALGVLFAPKKDLKLEKKLQTDQKN